MLSVLFLSHSGLWNTGDKRRTEKRGIWYSRGNEGGAERRDVRPRSLVTKIEGAFGGFEIGIADVGAKIGREGRGKRDILAFRSLCLGRGGLSVGRARYACIPLLVVDTEDMCHGKRRVEDVELVLRRWKGAQW